MLDTLNDGEWTLQAISKLLAKRDSLDFTIEFGVPVDSGSHDCSLVRVAIVFVHVKQDCCFVEAAADVGGVGLTSIATFNVEGCYDFTATGGKCMVF